MEEKGKKQIARFLTNKYVDKIVLVIGAFLITLRLFFPVLVCKNEYTCPQGKIVFCAFNQPMEGYSIHVIRTNMQAIGMLVLTMALYFVLKKGKK